MGQQILLKYMFWDSHWLTSKQQKTCTENVTRLLKSQFRYVKPTIYKYPKQKPPKNSSPTKNKKKQKNNSPKKKKQIITSTPPPAAEEAHRWVFSLCGGLGEVIWGAGHVEDVFAVTQVLMDLSGPRNKKFFFCKRGRFFCFGAYMGFNKRNRKVSRLFWIFLGLKTSEVWRFGIKKIKQEGTELLLFFLRT